MSNASAGSVKQKNQRIHPQTITHPPSKVFSVRLQADSAARVMQLATARGLTSGGMLSAMLDDYLNQVARTQFQETLVTFADRLARRDDHISDALGRLERRLDGFETLLQEATGAAGTCDV